MTDPNPDTAGELTLPVVGMTCASCVNRIEHSWAALMAFARRVSISTLSARRCATTLSSSTAVGSWRRYFEPGYEPHM